MSGDVLLKQQVIIDGTMSATLLADSGNGWVLVDLGFGFTTTIERDRIALVA